MADSSSDSPDSYKERRKSSDARRSSQTPSSPSPPPPPPSNEQSSSTSDHQCQIQSPASPNPSTGSTQPTGSNGPGSGSRSRAANPPTQSLVSYLRVKRKAACNLLLVPIYSLVLLLLVATTTFWYLRSLDAAIQIEQNYQELRGHCVPLRVPVCQRHRVPYSYTISQNYAGHASQVEVNQDLLDFEPMMGVKCYALLPLFLCSMMAPKCNSSGFQVPPCRSVCLEAQKRCNFFLAVFGLSWPQELDCNQLPDNSDPDICVGHQENRQMKLRSYFCNHREGFRCDSSPQREGASRCIPLSWRCDGFIDCQDSADEKNCSNCSQSQFYCGNNVCIDKENICDGFKDCPDGRDERQCFRLNGSMGHTGQGRLEAWSAEADDWRPVCGGTNWQEDGMSHKACHALGYKVAVETRMKEEPVNELSLRNGISVQKTGMKVLFDRSRVECDNQASVYLKCDSFECGKPAQKFTDRKRRRRIVGGDESPPGKWPWLVAIHGGPEEIFFCGGVLISQQWILTAAHCIGNQTNPTEWTVNLGVTRRTASPFYVQTRKVRRLVKHPGFNPSAQMYSSDIALILLDSPVNFDEFLRPVCLPRADLKNMLPGTYCTVIGWGKSIHDDNADYLSTVHEVMVPIVSRSLCSQWYQEQDVKIPDGMICAGYPEGKKDSCQGDSGGPLLCHDHGQRWFVAGVVSWGINCAQPHLPGIYTEVPKFLDWIHNTTSQEDPLPADFGDY